MRRGRIRALLLAMSLVASLAATLAACASRGAPTPPAAPAGAGAPAPAAAPAAAATPRVGPAHGVLIVAGGGQLGPEIWSRFVALAGGPDARIVVIPTAAEGDSFPDGGGVGGPLRQAGARHIAVLHTRDRATAESPEFVRPIRDATGVWIPGGRQWRLTDAYLGTRTERELHRLLERGGVIGGSSAGASVQASYMVRGAPQGNSIMMAPGHEQGFGFLRGVAVDQHLITRHRERDMLDVVVAHPELLGLGLDEGTAIEVHGDTAVVLGRSRMAVYNAGRGDDGESFFFLDAGDALDLGARRVLRRGSS